MELRRGWAGLELEFILETAAARGKHDNVNV